MGPTTEKLLKQQLSRDSLRNNLKAELAGYFLNIYSIKQLFSRKVIFE